MSRYDRDMPLVEGNGDPFSVKPDMRAYRLEPMSNAAIPAINTKKKVFNNIFRGDLVLGYTNIQPVVESATGLLSNTPLGIWTINNMGTKDDEGTIDVDWFYKTFTALGFNTFEKKITRNVETSGFVVSVDGQKEVMNTGPYRIGPGKRVIWAVPRKDIEIDLPNMKTKEYKDGRRTPWLIDADEECYMRTSGAIRESVNKSCMRIDSLSDSDMMNIEWIKSFAVTGVYMATLLYEMGYIRNREPLSISKLEQVCNDLGLDYKQSPQESKCNEKFNALVKKMSKGNTLKIMKEFKDHNSSRLRRPDGSKKLTNAMKDLLPSHLRWDQKLIYNINERTVGRSSQPAESGKVFNILIKLGG